MFGNLYDFSEDNNAYSVDYICYEGFMVEKEEDIEIELIVASDSALPVNFPTIFKTSGIKENNYLSVKIFKPPKLS